MALRCLKRHYCKSDLPAPEEEVLLQKAAQVVDEAHRIAGQRGRNVLMILKEMLEEIKRR